MKASLLAILLFAVAFPAFAQKMQTPTGEAPGPWIFGTIGVGKQPDGTIKTTALKGLAIKVGEHGEAAVAYDLDLCRMVGAWTGKFVTPMNLMSRGEYPTAMGYVAFTTGDVAGFITEAKEPWKEPRAEPFGPLPPGQARFRGFYVNGNKAVLKWDVGGVEVLEMPDYETRLGVSYFSRTFEIGPRASAMTVVVCGSNNLAPHSGGSGGGYGLWIEQVWKGEEANEPSQTPWRVFALLDPFNNRLGMDTVLSRGTFPMSEKQTRVGDTEVAGHYAVEIGPSKLPTRCKFVLWSGAGEEGWEKFDEALQGLGRDGPWPPHPEHGSPSGKLRNALHASEDLPSLTKGGPARWAEPGVTQGELAKDNSAAYVVDTIKLPDPNPWGAPMFLGGFDFFADGRAAVSTFHGDVFIVSGIDEKLEQVSWRRVASGLYHPLGLKIVNGEIYVTCRDGITRLKDLNGDGEADFYERFNNDLKVTKNFHEFVFDLQTDPAGNFYFSKAGPVKNGGRGFDQIMSQHGTVMRVTPDGAKLDVIATGFRAPNGIGVGPRGELTSGDNEGTWMPACKINWIKSGGFYGVVDLAHRNPPPTSYDPPLCWLPKRVDNSGGSQVWVPEGERWGPWGGKLLHLSYGQSSLFGVLAENIEHPTSNIEHPTMQGGVVRFSLQFQSGIMRARFNPKDGQLYVSGLRGWQTNGLKNGCFQRVRYTGAVPRMPIEMHARKGGIEVRFACSLDTQAASDPENWDLEQWRYLWSSAYGSPELSVAGSDGAPGELGKDGRAEFTTAQMQKPKHDAVMVKSIAIGTDDRSVFLEIPELKPVMQMSIKYDLKSADGAELRGEIVNTIHALPTE